MTRAGLPPARVLACWRSGRALLGLAALAAAAGCTSKTGTIALDLTTAPGSTLLDRVVQLRLTVTNPPQVLVVDRTERGFDLALDLEADGAFRAIAVDGLDAAGAIAATGRSPLVPLSAIDARIVVYMAPPMSIGAAPVSVEPARSRSSAAALSYGAVLAGGVDAAGSPSDAIQIYNAYDHSLTKDRPMPAARTGVTLAATAQNGVFLFGGAGPDGAATGTLWFFNTTTAPAGEIAEISDLSDFKRTGRAAVPLGADTYLITGAPALRLAGSQIAAATELAALSSGASVTGTDRVVTSVLVDDATGDLNRLRSDPLDPLKPLGALEPLGAQRKNGVAVALPDRRIAVFGGDAAPRDALIVDPATGALTPVAGALADAYAAVAIAATPRFVVVAGSRAGLPSTAIEVLDAATLERRYTTAVDDAITAAIALPNEQVLLIGATLQLFTPPPHPDE